MPSLQANMREASVVVTGAFNPTIFHPSWFLRYQVLGPKDVEEDKLELVHRELTRFPLLNGGKFEVTTDRFQISTKDVTAFALLRDVTVSTFTHLSHTPVEHLGINSKIEFRLPDEETWHRVGDVLAPKKIWEATLPKPVRLLGLFLRSETRSDGLAGMMHVRVTGTNGFGIEFDINNHLDLKEGGTERLRELVMENWERLQDEAFEIAKATLEQCLEGRLA